MAPLLAELPVPDAEAPTSNGLTGSRPLYELSLNFGDGLAGQAAAVMG